MRESKRISAEDPSVDGHPCEAAIAFRDIVVRSDVTEEVPADVLDLCMQFAWLGKAVSRTGAIHQWFLSGIDPNTRDIIPAMAIDSHARGAALNQALTGEALPGMAESLRSVRECLAFKQAVKTVSGLCNANPATAEVMRLAVLCGISQRLSGVKRLAKPPAGEVVSFDAFRKRRKSGR
jgi:hypothetical protein